MRLINAKSKDVLLLLHSIDCIAARDVLAEFPTVFIGSVFITIVAVAMTSFVAGFPAKAIGACVLLLWIAFFGWRAYFTNRNWVCAIGYERLLVRLFRNLGHEGITAAEPDVLEFASRDVALSVQVIEIIWSSIRRTTIRCLCIEPKADRSGTHDVISELEMFSNYSCETPKHRISVCQHGRVLVEWAYKHPRLEDFLQQVLRKQLLLSIEKTKYASLDLRELVLMPEHERRSLLLKLKQFGFRDACVRMLKRRLRMSAADAVQLMNSL